MKNKHLIGLVGETIFCYADNDNSLTKRGSGGGGGLCPAANRIAETGAWLQGETTGGCGM